MSKELHRYKCEVQEHLSEGSLSYVIRYAAITAESKAEAKRIAAQNVKHFKLCKVEQVTEAQPDAAKGIEWLI